MCLCVLQMILYYRKHHGTGLPLRHTLTIGLHIAAALWHLHPSVVHRYSTHIVLLLALLNIRNLGTDTKHTEQHLKHPLSAIPAHCRLSSRFLSAYASPCVLPGSADLSCSVV